MYIFNFGVYKYHEYRNRLLLNAFKGNTTSYFDSVYNLNQFIT